MCRLYEVLPGLSDGQNQEKESYRVAVTHPHSKETLGKHLYKLHQWMLKGS